MDLNAIDRTFNVLGATLGKERPLVRLALRYWWLALPTAWVIYKQVRERQKKGQVTPFTIATDVGMIITPAIGLITLAEVVGSKYTTASPLQPATPVTDADFTVDPNNKSGAEHV